MLDVQATLTVLLVYSAGVIIPGPNFVSVAHCAATESRANALAMVGGIVLVNLVWASAAILGVAAVFNAFPIIALVVKLVAAAYLCWIGIHLIRNSGQSTTYLPASQVAQTASFTAFKRGVSVNIINPKSVAFYAATFSAAAPQQVSTSTLLAMLSVVLVIGLGWYSAVALALSSSAVSSRVLAYKPWFDRVCGAVLLTLGLKQAAS